MKPTFLKTLTFGALLTGTGIGAHAAAPILPVRMGAVEDALIKREEGSYRRITLPVPKDIVLEASGVLPIANHALLVTTRRGEIWRIDGAYGDDPHPTFTLWAQGLHEPLGIIPAPPGGYYVAAREEVLRVADVHGTGRADHFETIANIPVSGNYHEYTHGPVMGPHGRLRIALNVAFGAKTQSPVPWRGWMMEINPDGSLQPIAAGLRSPAGMIYTSHGDWLYTENQGEWVGAGKVTEVRPGDFCGHPASLAWSDLPGSTVHLHIADIPDTGRPLHEAAKQVPGLKLPAVWLPYAIMGISTSGIVENVTQGRFGPFEGQFFIGDQGQSKVMRMSLERVKGVLQGACYPFLSGFQCGILRLSWGDDGSLFVGETNRGWGSVGTKEYGLERVVWRGTVPFEVKEITAQPDGFRLQFTAPVDRATAAKTASYAITSFTYRYHHIYGSPIIDAAPCPILKAIPSEDGLSVRLAVGCLRQDYIHEIKIPGVRHAGDGASPVHDTAYYTLNELPDGPRIVPAAALAQLCTAAAAPTAASGPSPKHPTDLPVTWHGSPDRVITIETRSGLKFDPVEITVKAGQHLALVLHNGDDMLHNFVLTAPGRGQAVGAASLAMGIEGPGRNYVPDSPDVLYHTVLLQPGQSDGIYFTAPPPGTYDYICSFPGHAMLMHGVLRVVRSAH